MPTRFEQAVRSEHIALSVPEIRGNEWAFVKECLDTAWISSAGKYVDRFERAAADYVGRKFAVATVNGTAALHISLIVAGVQRDDEVIVSDMTFVAPANAVRYIGAHPRFVDAEPVHFQMDVARLTELMKREYESRNGVLRNISNGRRLAAIVPVHILGHPCDLDPIIRIADRHRIPVVEDATESLGSMYKGAMVGRAGTLACLSFNGNKIISSGGGGMILTDDEQLAKRAKYLTTQAKDDPVEYVHNEIGYNYRLPNVLAAIGVAQMERLAEYVAQKRRIAQRYQQGLRNLRGIHTPNEASWATSNFWLYTIRLQASEAGLTSRDLMDQLTAEKVESRPLWRPMHRLPEFAPAISHSYPVADRLYEECLSVPCSVGLTEVDQDAVIEIVRTAATRAAGRPREA